MKTRTVSNSLPEHGTDRLLSYSSNSRSMPSYLPTKGFFQRTLANSKISLAFEFTLRESSV
jgi:hypothetical protein